MMSTPIISNRLLSNFSAIVGRFNTLQLKRKPISIATSAVGMSNKPGHPVRNNAKVSTQINNGQINAN